MVRELAGMRPVAAGTTHLKPDFEAACAVSIDGAERLLLRLRW
jgi:hypothetical protein